MAFMQPEIVHGEWYEVDGPRGTEIIPAELVGTISIIRGNVTIETRYPTLDELQAYDRMSALLNGYANSQNAPMAWAGWMMGAATPSLVLILSKVASLQWRKRRYSTARFTAGVGIGLLALSVWHCANAIAALTSSHLCLALPIAVAVDCGLVACEVASLEGYHV
jgi:hypothetical protein